MTNQQEIAMLSRAWTTTLLIAACASVSISAAAPAWNEGQYNDNPPYNFHGEVDKTDIFAIPLDNSEEEQDEELDSFEKYSEEHQKPGK
jgi:hypothetical protein